MKINDRKSVNESLKVFDPTKTGDSFIEVTEWSNEEGCDIVIDERIMSLSYPELEAINYLCKTLEYYKNENMERNGRDD